MKIALRILSYVCVGCEDIVFIVTIVTDEKSKYLTFGVREQNYPTSLSQFYNAVSDRVVVKPESFRF